MPIAFPRKPRVAICAAALAFAFAFLAPAATISQSSVPAIVPASNGEPWTGDGVAKLGLDVDGMLANDVSLRGAHVGVFAIETASGKVLYARDADGEFQPASTLKLLVGSAALERLGPNYAFHTQLETLAAPAAVDATRVAALLLRAGGDPFLAQSDFDEAARAVATGGIDAVSGTYIDDSHDDRIPYAPGWTWDDFAYDYAARISAMTFEENVAHLTVTAGTAVGSAALVRAAPPVRVVASLEGCDAARANEIEVATTAPTGAAGTPSTVDVRVGSGGCLEVFGSLPLGGAPESIDAAVTAPLVYARSALERSLRARDVTLPVPSAPLAGSIEESIRRIGPGERVLWRHDSAPLETWLGPRFWIPSDNLVGELLLKELGFATAGAPGSDETGIAFETAWLQSIGVDPATVTLADGSGLSQYDRITPRDLVAILQHDWNGPNRRLVLDSLPVGAARGTIEGIAGTLAAGRVFAKTGSMMHVRGLAGYLATRRHGAVTFAFDVDDWNGRYAALAALRARVLSRIVGD